MQGLCVQHPLQRALSLHFICFIRCHKTWFPSLIIHNVLDFFCLILIFILLFPIIDCVFTRLFIDNNLLLKMMCLYQFFSSLNNHNVLDFFWFEFEFGFHFLMSSIDCVSTWLFVDNNLLLKMLCLYQLYNIDILYIYIYIYI